jgi:hypothetical protein
LLQENGRAALSDLIDSVQFAKRDRLLVASSKVVDTKAREEAGEIAEWLRIWLDSPELFRHWSELRRQSPEFQERFEPLPEAAELEPSD